MAYTRPCNKCGQRISMREMPHGQWVAFDVSTEDTHVCGTTHEPDPNIEKLAKKNKSRRKNDDDEEILLKRQEKLQTEEETYDTSSGINNCIKKAIKKKKRIDITYRSYGGQVTSRQISPVKKFKYKNANHLQAYCHMRSAERNFKIASILEANLTNKKIFKSKKMGKPTLGKYLEKVNLKNDKSSEEIYISDYPGPSLKPGEAKDDFKKVDNTLEIIFFLAIIGAIISYIFG